MGTTYLKRQKEMKRLEKQREKAERRAQKRLANHAQSEVQGEGLSSTDYGAAGANITVPGTDNISSDHHENSPDPNETPLK
jgi:hypothetical protein